MLEQADLEVEHGKKIRVFTPPQTSIFVAEKAIFNENSGCLTQKYFYGIIYIESERGGLRKKILKFSH